MKFIKITFILFVMSVFFQQNVFASFAYDKQKEQNAETLRKNSKPLFDTEKICQESKDGVFEYQMAVQYHMQHVYRRRTEERHNLEEAIRLYNVAIEKGNSAAMCNLAGIYQEGEHVEQNLEKAVELYNWAIEAGNPYAKLSLANICNKVFENPKIASAELLSLIAAMYQHGIGVEQNFEKAVNFYKYAIKGGNIEAAYDLASMYQEDGVKQNLEKAVYFYKFAIQGGNSTAMCNLALIYYGGNGVEQDLGEVVRLLKLAIENGHRHAPQFLATLYYDGDEIDQDFVKAAELYEIALENETISGSNLLNLFNLYDEGTHVKQNLQRAKLLFKMGIQKLHQEIEQNNENALKTLCNLYYKFDNYKLVSMVRVVCNSLQGDNSYLWDDELLFLKTTSQLFKFKDAEFDDISEFFPCTRQNNYLNKSFLGNGQEYFDFMIKSALHLQELATDKELNNFLSTDKEFKNFYEENANLDLQFLPQKQFKEISEYAVEILSYAPMVLNSDNCFIPVTEKIYALFPCAQWNSKQNNCLRFPLETSADVGMCFYKIWGKHYVTLKQKEIDICDKLMTALYKPTLTNMSGKNCEIITNHFVLIQRGFEMCLDYGAPWKVQRFSINKNLDETLKNGFLFN